MTACAPQGAVRDASGAAVLCPACRAFTVVSVTSQRSAAPAYRFRLHDLACDELGTLGLPYVNVERGDSLTLGDGRSYVVRRVVLFDDGHPLAGMLQLAPADGLGAD